MVSDVLSSSKDKIVISNVLAKPSNMNVMRTIARILLKALALFEHGKEGVNYSVWVKYREIKVALFYFRENI